MGDVRHLDPKVCIIWLFPPATALAFFLLIGLAGIIVAPENFSALGMRKADLLPAIVAITAVLAAAAYLWTKLTYSHFTYELGEKSIIIREGLFTRKTDVIPYATIQDISSERTPLERFLGLATLEIETAGSSRTSSEMLLPGIANKDALIAEVMQRVIEAKGGLGAEVDGRASRPISEQLLSDILKELKTLSSKLEGLQPRTNRNSSKAHPPPGKKSAFDEYEEFRGGSTQR